MKNKLIIGFLLIILLLGTIVFLQWRKTSPVSLSVKGNTTIDLTPTEIAHIRRIARWEFLTMKTEEMVDTTASSFWGNRRLCRIYTGTLRLGVDMSKAPQDWCTPGKDSTVVLKLPPIGLLNKDFIDEAATRSFYEKGEWTAADREALYQRAALKMRQRLLTPENLKTAEENAREAYTTLFTALGFKKVTIVFNV